MTDHFTLTFDEAELTSAMTKFGALAEQLGAKGEGGKLANLKGNDGAWTGAAATALLGEMGVIATTMTGASPKFTDAHDAVSTFTTALDHAKNDTLPKLNTRWSDADDAYDTATTKARTAYTSATRPDHNDPDAAPARVEAGKTRDKAIADAGTTRDTTRTQINGDYDAMVATLKTAAKTCGDALGSATVVHFSAEQWKQVKGGTIPIGLKFQLRSQIFGADTVLHHSDGLVVGQYAAQKVAADAKTDSTGPMDPELLDLLKTFGKDPAFVEGLETTIGPEGTAWLGLRAYQMQYGYGSDNNKTQGAQLFDAMKNILGTASYLTVPTEDGGTKPLIDNAWLDHYDPQAYSELSDANRGSFNETVYLSGYQPGLLLPFLTDKNAVSPEVSALIAQRALRDYEAAHKDGEPLTYGDAWRRWELYSGWDNANSAYNTRTGDDSNPFAVDTFHTALERAGDYGSSANTVMLTHRDTMLFLMTGGDPMLSGGNGPYGKQHDWLSSPLSTILKQATIGYEGTDPSSADAALWGVADYLKHHGDAHFLHDVNVALGEVVTDPRMFDGAMSSVTGPNFAGDGFLDDPNHPNAGPLMSPELWAALHREAMLVPESAAQIIAQTGDYINQTGDYAQHQGYVWDPNKHELVPDNHVTSLSLYQSEAARHFLGQNLLADHDALVTAMENELEQVHQDKDRAKAVVGQLVDWAKDPTSIVGDVKDKLVDFGIDTVVDWAYPSDSDIQGKYDASITALTNDLNNPIVKPGFWDDVNQKANQAVSDIYSGSGPATVDAVVPGYTDASGHKTYTGDPADYIGKESQYVGGGSQPVITDDFLTYGSNGKPDGVLPIGEMNTLQRQAYMNWLHDPAVQAYLDGEVTAVDDARKRAGG